MNTEDKKMSGKKIVIVEDEQVLQKALSIEFLADGVIVLAASNGKAGLELVQKESPDLVLLDLILPEMKGFDVLAALKKDAKTKKIPVIILSNLGQDEDKEKGLALGALAYYVKSSTDLSALSEEVRKILAKS